MNESFEIGCLSIIQKQAARAATVLNENEKDLNGTRRSSDSFFLVSGIMHLFDWNMGGAKGLPMQFSLSGARW